MTVKVSRWGDGLAIRLPDDLVNELHLQEGDRVEIRAVGDRTIEIEVEYAREKP